MGSKPQNDRGKAWRRHKNYSKAKRKQKIDKSIHTYSFGFYGFYNNLHQYSDNKIHCSCPMCRRKSYNRGAAALYHGSYNPSMMDWRRQISMDNDYLEYFDDID